MEFAQWMLIPITLMHVPLNVFATREQINSYFQLDKRWRNHFALTFVISTLAFVLPLVYPDIIGLLGIFGGTLVAYVGLICPFLLKVRMLDPLPWYSCQKLPYVLGIVFVSFIGFGSVYISVVGSP